MFSIKLTLFRGLTEVVPRWTYG